MLLLNLIKLMREFPNLSIKPEISINNIRKKLDKVKMMSWNLRKLWA
jgi:hypothetical protein